MKVIKPNDMTALDGGFSRATAGTYYGSDTVVKTAAINEPRFQYNPNTTEFEGLLTENASTNMFRYSENLENSAWSKVNATMNQTLVSSPSETTNANLFIENLDTSLQHSLFHSVLTVTSGLQYTFSVFIKNYSSNRSVRIQPGGATYFGLNMAYVVFDPVGGTIISTAFSVTSSDVKKLANGWYRVSVTAPCILSGSGVDLGTFVSLTSSLSTITTTYNGDGVSGVYLWGAQLEQSQKVTSYIPSAVTFTGRTSIGTYVNSSGNIQTASTGVSRLQYNQLKLTAPSYLLLEPAVTNLFIASDDINTWGTKNNCTVSSNVIASPDGTTNADKVVSAVATGVNIHVQRALSTNTATVDNTLYTFSAFVKAAEFTWCYLSFGSEADTGTNTNTKACYFNLNTGVKGTAGSEVINPIITAFPNGWYRVSIVFNSLSGANAVRCRVGFADSDLDAVCDGDGVKGLYAWGVQLEQSPYPTSYIPTVGTTVARSADTSTSVATSRSADVIVGSGLIYTTVTDPNALWSSGTTYALANKVRYLGKIWESLQGTNLNHPPDTSPTWWLDLGADNLHAALDTQVSTATSATTSMTIVLKPGIFDSVALIDMDSLLVEIGVFSLVNGSTYSRVVGLSGAEVYDWYQYFFYDPLDIRTQVIFQDIPQYSDSVVTLKFTGSTGALVSVAQIIAGVISDIGTTQEGATAGIVDYSKKETDEFGNTTFVKRNFSKRLSCNTHMTNTDLNRVQKFMYGIRATPSVWIGTDNPDLEEALVVYGFYKDFSTQISYPTHSVMSLEVEGLT
jgi:hypothetical protein